MRLNHRIRVLIAGMIVSVVFTSGCSGSSEISVTSFGRSEGMEETNPSGLENSGTEAAKESADSASPGQPNAGTQTGMSEETGSSGEDQNDDSQEEIQMLAVYVCGAVQEPDVYYLPVGARIYDALQAAGGFTEDADSQWLNQAQPLTDGQMLLVYTAQETAQMELEGAKRGENTSGTVSSGSGSSGGAASGTGTDSSIVNLNTGTKEQLMTLPGIGESKADAIIRYRTETGMFGCVEDIMNISGIKNSTFDKIKDKITV